MPSAIAGPGAMEGIVRRRYRILVCTPFPPRLDARHGGRATSQLLSHLADRHDVTLLFLRSEVEAGVDEALAERCSRVQEVAIRSTSASASWSARAAQAYQMIGGLPSWAAACRSETFAERLRALVLECRPDVVEFHLQVMAQYGAAIPDEQLPKILVDYDPPSAWAAELMGQVRGVRRLARRMELGAWRRYERRTRPPFHAVVVFAERDVAAASATSDRVPVVRIPLAFDLPRDALDPVGKDPPTVLFFGGFGHPPNVDAARWLAGSIFPRVLERVPESRLALVGDKPGEEVLQLAGGAVSVHGSVPDVNPYLDRAAVVVAPIRFGGSMRGKVLESLGAGKALVATPRAAEGVDAVPGREFILAATEDELVEGVVMLLRDPDQRSKLARRARAWAVGNLSWERSLTAFEELYASLLQT